jgi:glutathione S-transferase
VIELYSLSAFRPDLKGLIRDLRAVWALEELGLPYHRNVLDPIKREHKAPAYLELNPFGKVPTIKDDGFVLFESSAICSYLADKAGKLIPKAGTRERVIYDQWLAFSISTFEPMATRIFSFDFIADKNPGTDKIRNETLNIVDGFAGTLDFELSKRPYLLGQSFSMADIALSSAARYVLHTELTAKHVHFEKYLQKNYQRPAFIKSLELNGV